MVIRCVLITSDPMHFNTSVMHINIPTRPAVLPLLQTMCLPTNSVPMSKSALISITIIALLCLVECLFPFSCYVSLVSAINTWLNVCR